MGGRGPQIDPTLPLYREECGRRNVVKRGNLPVVVDRLRNVELKVMTWNLADFSTTGVVQGRLWNKEDTTAAGIDAKPKRNKCVRKRSGGTKSSSQTPAPETPACTGRLTLVADTIADEAPDVVFIQEVSTNDDNIAVMELTEKLNKLMKSRKLDVWINAKAVVQKSKHDITYEHTQSEKLKNEGPGGEKYGCVWNTSKFEGPPTMSYLVNTEERVSEFAGILGAENLWEEIARDLQVKVLVDNGGFSRFPALFTFTPKHGGPKADNNTKEKIHFLVFHLASSNPKYGGPEKNRAEMRVLQSLARHAWKAGSRLILLGDHNAGECGTTPRLKEFEKDNIGGQFVVKTTESTNLFPFMKGAGAQSAVKDNVGDLLAFLKEHEVDLYTHEADERMHRGVKLQYKQGNLVVKTGLKTALKQIIVDEGLGDSLQLSGARHNDNIIIPKNTVPTGAERTQPARKAKATLVRDLLLLEARVLEVPARKLLEYTIEHNEPFGSWKYLWSDHRPVVARFSLS